MRVEIKTFKMPGLNTAQESTYIFHKGIPYTISNIPNDIAQEITSQLQKGLAGKKTYIKPDLNQIISIKDFDEIAEKFLDPGAWAYFRTGAADEITLRENSDAFKRIFLKPRILKNVQTVDQSTTVLGTKISTPIYISAFARSVLGNELAEKNYTWAAAETDIIQMIPSMSKFSFEEILSEAIDGQTQWLQIYVTTTRAKTAELLNKAKAAGNVTSIIFTVDSAQLGKREYEERANGTPFNKKTPHDPSFNWDDIKYYKDNFDFKFILKGIQTIEDALKAIEYGMDAIIVSNHGGRQLDSARSSIEVLAEISPILKSKNLFDRIEILVDGGVRSGADVIKALSLGAKAVGLGRPFLYSASVYGKDGAVKAVNLLKEEIELNLRLLGVTSVDKLHSGLVDTRRL